MKSYLLVDIKIENHDQFREYAGQISDLIDKHGGHYLVRGAKPEIVSADTAVPEHIAVIEFPSNVATKAFLKERSDLGLADLFSKATTSRILTADGA